MIRMAGTRAAIDPFMFLAYRGDRLGVFRMERNRMNRELRAFLRPGFWEVISKTHHIERSGNLITYEIRVRVR